VSSLPICHPERSRIAAFRQFCAVEGPCVSSCDLSSRAKQNCRLSAILRSRGTLCLLFQSVIPSAAELPSFGNSAQSRDLVSSLAILNQSFPTLVIPEGAPPPHLCRVLCDRVGSLTFYLGPSTFDLYTRSLALPSALPTSPVGISREGAPPLSRFVRQGGVFDSPRFKESAATSPRTSALPCRDEPGPHRPGNTSSQSAL